MCSLYASTPVEQMVKCFSAVFIHDWFKVCLLLLFSYYTRASHVCKRGGISPQFHCVERHISSPSVNRVHLGLLDGRANIKPRSSTVLCFKVQAMLWAAFKSAERFLKFEFSILWYFYSAIPWECQLKIRLAGITSRDPGIQLKAGTVFIKMADEDMGGCLMMVLYTRLWC